MLNWERVKDHFYLQALCLLLLRDKVDEAKNLFLNILNSD